MLTIRQSAMIRNVLPRLMTSFQARCESRSPHDPRAPSRRRSAQGGRHGWRIDTGRGSANARTRLPGITHPRHGYRVKVARPRRNPRGLPVSAASLRIVRFRTYAIDLAQPGWWRSRRRDRGRARRAALGAGPGTRSNPADRPAGPMHIGTRNSFPALRAIGSNMSVAEPVGVLLSTNAVGAAHDVRP